MQLKKSNSQKIILICKGIAMGIANKIPGISGGIVALAAGFYEELIFSFSKFNKTALSLLLKTEFKAFYNYVNGSFLTLLFSGVILSFFSASLILDRLIQHYPKQVWGFFFGMILASVIHIWIKEKKFSYKEYTLILLGASFGILVSLVTPGQENDNLLFVFLCGMLSISGMILPGLSGSFLILVLGNYTLLLIDSVNALYYSLGDIVSFDFSFTDDPARMNLLGVLLVFTLGSVTGLLVLSKVLRWLLKYYPKKITALLIGFILGSLSITWPWKLAGNKTVIESEVTKQELIWPNLNEIQNIYVMLFILLGFGIVTLLEIYGKRNAK
ncbi:MAG: putative membrane protein [Flavobacteriales bacterium]|jgi:putative membrane protein